MSDEARAGPRGTLFKYIVDQTPNPFRTRSNPPCAVRLDARPPMETILITDDGRTIPGWCHSVIHETKLTIPVFRQCLAFLPPSPPDLFNKHPSDITEYRFASSRDKDSK